MTEKEQQKIQELRRLAIERRDERKRMGQTIDATFWNGAVQMADKIILELFQNL